MSGQAIVNFRVPPAERKRLHALARARGVTLSELLRAALARELAAE